MSHRKFEHPRCGSLAFLPRKRASRMRGRVKSFPKENPSDKPHLTAFLGYKAGMTHIVRDLDRPGSKMHKKEICEAVTVLEAPPLIVVGLVGYIETPIGLRALKSVWAQHLNEECRRRFYKNWTRSKRRAFSTYSLLQKNADDTKAKWVSASGDGKAATPAQPLQAAIDNIKKHALIVRAICHTQVSKVKLGPKKAHIAEIQVNGGTASEKVDFILKLFEQEVPIDAVFTKDELVDAIAVNKGHGFEGVIHRWGVTCLPRKTHRGLRKVACVGAWHPSRISFTVPRAGQHGCHHRTEANKKIYKVGKKDEKFDKTAPYADFTQKAISPLGGFVWYGPVNNDYLILKGSIPGTRKRVITLRKSLAKPTRKWMQEVVTLKFIDTSSKLGHGRFQTAEEKKKFFGAKARDNE